MVAVLGGKGGFGKSTLSVNLALTLTAMGHRVGLADGDLTGPDVPHLFGIRPTEPPRRHGWDLMTARVRSPSQRERPRERFGVELMSVGFAVPERMPLFVSGFVPMVLRAQPGWKRRGCACWGASRSTSSSRRRRTAAGRWCWATQRGR